MPQIQEIRIIQEKMRKAVQFTGSELGTIHAGKASPAMVEGVNVEVYGASSHLRDIAAITVPDPRTISIQPWDRGTVKPIEKALLTANLGFTPLVDSDRIRCVLPEMSRERRQEMAKYAANMAETGRISIRNIRRDAMDQFKALQKKGTISEDDLKRIEKEIQKITDTSIEEINGLLSKKEKELLTI